jgi:hypothetical protein
MIKTLKKLGIEGAYLNLKTINDKPMANIVPKGEKLRISSKIRKRQTCPVSHAI